MKQRRLLKMTLALSLVMFLVGQGCLLIGPEGGPGGLDLRGDLRVTWTLGLEGSCREVDVVEVEIRDRADVVVDKVRVDCATFVAGFRNLPVGFYTVVVFGINPLNEVIYQGSAQIEVREALEANLSVDLYAR